MGASGEFGGDGGAKCFLFRCRNSHRDCMFFLLSVSPLFSKHSRFSNAKNPSCFFGLKQRKEIFYRVAPVRFGYGLGMERFERFRFLVPVFGGGF